MGFCTSLTAGNLRASLMEFRQKFPHVELATVERPRAHLETALRNGTVDILVVTGNVPSSNSNTKLLWSERVLVVMSEEHPLVTREVVYWTDLQGQTLILS
ncbi:LysR substrate-binding domain-containing protein [Bradyrhizobium sp. BWA-3-5]|uniref:LysR substrate-binding domain-containing protein n=1 Tax=Bradyrhizobium sp. BWA-3-5 TaxID=3080013 RepID=UPI00293E986D|nr:LysR substrate-binding domain-containing protein [Bradyrhizobium sp. BWA-3-5]WOH69919.1 LysR substrate-binding domain-containing protein [Bradyrhizobium sp. BWA-3-5]